MEFRFRIDGKDLPTDLGNFDVVLFNFPYIYIEGGDTINATRQMLEQVVSQMETRLNAGGKLMIIQTERWAGPHQLPNLNFSTLAKGTGLSLVGDKKWKSSDFPEYNHIVTNPDLNPGTTPTIDPAVTYIFVKNE